MDARHIVDTLREPLVVLDSDLRIQTANRAFYRRFQVSPEQTEGQLIYELGNGQWNIPDLRRLLEEILPGNSVFDDFEVDHTFPDIGRKLMLLNARRIAPADQSPSVILLAMEDVTERRRLEQERRDLETRFTSLVKNIRDHSIFTLDPTGTITSWNKEAERILGYAEDEALGRNFSIIFSAEDQAAEIPQLELSTALSEGRAEDERWHVRKSGERFWAFGIVTPLLDESGQHCGFSKILRDMTAQKTAEEALREAHGLLELRVRKRTAELAQAHDQLLAASREREQAERARMDVQRQLASAQEEERLRISRELHDEVGQIVAGLILKLKSIEALAPEALAAEVRACEDSVNQIGKELHRLALELRPTSLNDLGLIDALRTYVKSWSERTGISTDYEVTGLGSARLTPEIETTLYRIVQEALNNVVKHAHAKHVALVLSRFGGDATAIVEDDGIGFDPAQISSRRLGVRGMRERAVLAGGALEIASEPGQGTTVHVRIPCFHESSE